MFPKFLRPAHGLRNAGSQFAKAEARLSRCCGEITASVLADVEHLLRQTRGLFGTNGQCTVANLKLLLAYHELTTSGPKVELVQRVHNHIDGIREAHGLQSDEAVNVDEHVGGDFEEGDNEDDNVCFMCQSGVVSEGNDILICEREH